MSNLDAISWSAVAGAAGALCSTLAFLPQLLKVRKQGGEDLSRGMLALVAVGAVMWFSYGVLTGATAVVVANAAVFMLISGVVVAAWMHARAGKRTTRRRRIGIDMDEVLADAFSEMLRRYNAQFGTTLTEADFRGRDVCDVVPAENIPALFAMFDASFFEDLEVFPDAQAVVRELHERHEVFIVTAAMEVPESFGPKYRWLREHFPFIPPTHIVFCGDKGIVDVDVLIDDRPRNFVSFKGQPLLFTAPHNVHVTTYPRVSSWQDVRAWFAALDGIQLDASSETADSMPSGLAPESSR